MFGNIVERIKTFILGGERKVKVKEEHKNKLSSFWNNFIHGIFNERVSGVLNNLGVKLTTLKKKKQEVEENDLKEKEETSIESQDSDKSQEIEEDSKEIHPPLQETFTFKGSSEMPKVPDTIATKEPEEEPEVDKEPVSEELDEKVKEILECVKNDDKEGFIKIIDEYGFDVIRDKVQDIFYKEQISEEENTAFIDMKNELYDEHGILKQKEEEVEEPITQEETKATTQEETEIKSSDIDLTDLTQFRSYTDYLKAYSQENISDEDKDRFWADLYNGILPADLKDEKAFISERKRQEDEKELRKYESDMAEAQKELAKVRAKLVAANERAAEFEAESKQEKDKLKEAREENVTLKQQMVDVESENSDLRRKNESLKKQLSTSQETAKKAQAGSYEDRKKLEETEKALAKDRATIEKLRKELQESKDREAEINKELEETKAKINKNIELARKQINSLKDYDDLEKTALSWTIIDSKKAEEEKKEHEDSAESKKEPLASKESKKIEVKDIPTVHETKKPEKTIEITEEEPQIVEPVFSKTSDEPKEEAQKTDETLVKAIEQEAGEQETSKIEIKPAYVSGPNGIDSEKLKSALAGVVAEAQEDESSIKPKTR